MVLSTKLIFILTTTSTGLIAGLLYAYSCSVNLGLNRLEDSAYLSAMQHINKAILNPCFFFTFMGSALFLPICTFLQYQKPFTSCFNLLLAATLIYLVGVLGVTLFGNVPLNDALANFDISRASMDEIKMQRAQFEPAWNNFHFYRTLAAVCSFVLVILALVFDTKLK